MKKRRRKKEEKKRKGGRKKKEKKLKDKWLMSHVTPGLTGRLNQYQKED